MTSVNATSEASSNVPGALGVEDTVQFTIGIEATSSEGVCGEVRRVVIDPVARKVTHLVIEPRHRQGVGRLVPLDLVDVIEGEVHICATVTEFDELAEAEATAFLPGVDDDPGYRRDQVYAWPYYALASDFGMGNAFEPVTYDRVPLDEIEIGRGEQVHATDGPIGKVQGLVIDRADHNVTHVLLQEGHLRGRKEVAIPITAVTSVDDGTYLSLTKSEVQELPAVGLDHRDS